MNLHGSIKRISTSVIVLFFMGILTHCAIIPPPPKNQPLTWKKRTEQLSAINNWDLEGALGFRMPQDNIGAQLHWQQKAKHYTIFLAGPLGSNSVILTGKPRAVQLATSEGKKYTAQNAETLLLDKLHWRLPVSNLVYWIRGLPAPYLPADIQFDSFNRITHMKQQGWDIQFLRYTAVENTDLPSKLVLTYPYLQVRIVVRKWSIVPR